MREVTIARNYAEALVELAAEHQALEPWASLLDATAAAFRTPGIEEALMSPRVPRDEKIRLVRDALRDAPRPFTLFIVAVIHRGRQVLLSQIADQYRILVDGRLNRVRAGITLARDVDALTRQVIVERLSQAMGKQVIAGFAVDPALLGGVVVRVGDRIYDGSVRRRLGALRRTLLA